MVFLSVPTIESLNFAKLLGSKHLRTLVYQGADKQLEARVRQGFDFPFINVLEFELTSTCVLRQ